MAQIAVDAPSADKQKDTIWDEADTLPSTVIWHTTFALLHLDLFLIYFSDH